MKLNHINLTVTDVPTAEAFLKKYFGLRNEWEDEANQKFVVLFDDAGMVITLMKAGQVKYPGIFHIGFGQATEEAVNALNRRMHADGYDVQPPQRSHAWTFYVEAPGGFLVEVFC